MARGVYIGAGELDERVRFQAFSETRDEHGYEEPTWADLQDTPETWAAVEPIGGREFFASQRIVAEAEVGFTIRYRGDLSVENRIVYRGETYDILRLDPLGRRREFLSIQASRAQQ